MDKSIFEGIDIEKGRELLALAATAAGPEDIAKMAAEQGIDLSAEAAKEIFDRLSADAVLSDDEMNEAAGGSCCWDSPCTLPYYYG